MLYVDYTQYSFYVKCSRLKKAYFVALSNTRMLSQMCNQKTYIRTHKTEIMDVILCVAVVFIGMCFEIPWP